MSGGPQSFFSPLFFPFTSFSSNESKSALSAWTGLGTETVHMKSRVWVSEPLHVGSMLRKLHGCHLESRTKSLEDRNRPWVLIRNWLYCLGFQNCCGPVTPLHLLLYLFEHQCFSSFPVPFVPLALNSWPTETERCEGFIVILKL